MSGEEDSEVPLEDLADEVRQRRESDAEDDDLFEDAFVEHEFEEVDTEELWEELEASGSSDIDEFAAQRAASAADHGTPDVGEIGADEEVVPKTSYCERCRWFSDPPEARCTHEGTEIVEFVDNDHVRVRDCPVVAERREVGEVIQSDPVE